MEQVWSEDEARRAGKNTGRWWNEMEPLIRGIPYFIYSPEGATDSPSPLRGYKIGVHPFAGVVPLPVILSGLRPYRGMRTAEGMPPLPVVLSGLWPYCGMRTAE